MAVNVFALRTTSDGRVAETADELVLLCQERMGGEWALVSANAKLSKLLFEADFNGRRVIGKVSHSKRARGAFTNLTKLWEAGMCPPSRHTIPQPIGWFPEPCLLVQEKAPGLSIWDVMKQGNADEYARDAANWLRRMWSLEVQSDVACFDGADARQRGVALSEKTGDSRVATLAREAAEALEKAPGPYRPSHGDFHPMNVFVSEDRVTAIDLDTFGLREREADVAYFLAQSAIFGLHLGGSFRETHSLRDDFLAACGAVNLARVSIYMAWALLQSVHYDLCILKIENQAAGQMIDAAERLLDRQTVDIPS